MIVMIMRLILSINHVPGTCGSFYTYYFSYLKSCPLYTGVTLSLKFNFLSGFLSSSFLYPHYMEGKEFLQ